MQIADDKQIGLDSVLIVSAGVRGDGLCLEVPCTFNLKKARAGAATEVKECKCLSRDGAATASRQCKAWLEASSIFAAITLLNL